MFSESCPWFGGELRGWIASFNQLLMPGSWQGLVMEVEDTFMNETDRIPSFRELSGQ